MELADRFGLPVISLIDTAGAFPGVEAEERGQAEAIARSTDACLALGVPNIAVVIGEGGSGGALAIAACNTVLMLEHAIYTVASPEAAASILWRDSSRAQEAATGMKITAQDLIRFGIIDGIIPEPLGGAHRDPAGGHRLGRPGDQRRAEIAAQPGPGRIAQRAGGEVSGHGAEDLGSSAPPPKEGQARDTREESHAADLALVRAGRSGQPRERAPGRRGRHRQRAASHEPGRGLERRRGREAPGRDRSRRPRLVGGREHRRRRGDQDAQRRLRARRSTTTSSRSATPRAPA